MNAEDDRIMRGASQIPSGEIEPSYIIGFYDVPLSGRCRWNDHECYYEIINDPDVDDCQSCGQTVAILE